MNAPSRNRFPALLATAALLVAPGCATGPKGGNATVQFGDPARYSDLQTPGKSREQTAQSFLPQLQSEVEAAARDSIPAGYTVNLDITEIDQAGIINNPGGAFPIRVTGDNTPAVIAFNYTVTGPTGQVVKSGQQRLVRTIADIQPYLDDDSPVPVLNYMIGNWMGSLGWELSHASR